MIVYNDDDRVYEVCNELVWAQFRVGETDVMEFHLPPGCLGTIERARLLVYSGTASMLARDDEAQFGFLYIQGWDSAGSISR